MAIPNDLSKAYSEDDLSKAYSEEINRMMNQKLAAVASATAAATAANAANVFGSSVDVADVAVDDLKKELEKKMTVVVDHEERLFQLEEKLCDLVDTINYLKLKCEEYEKRLEISDKRLDQHELLISPLQVSQHSTGISTPYAPGQSFPVQGNTQWITAPQTGSGLGGIAKWIQGIPKP